MLSSIYQYFDTLGPILGSLLMLFIFLLASAVMIWRLEQMSKRGLEGTVLGALCMPYLSGFGNLVFVYVILNSEASGHEVLTNCLVNNVTNATLLLGLPALIWGLNVLPGKKDKSSAKTKKTARISRLSLVLTLIAMLFFTGVLWALSKDGNLQSGDGITLVAIFLFWQCFHIYEVLKANVNQPNGYRLWMLIVDGSLLILCALCLYISVDWLVLQINQANTPSMIRENLGLFSGWLMVIPNAFLAFYYALKKRADVVYSSQIGDSHICIPLCIGLFATFKPIEVATTLNLGLTILGATGALHIAILLLFGRLHRITGAFLCIAYGVFLYLGFL